MYKPKKLIMSIFTLGLTIATLTTSTYAWFAKNSETWVDDFSMDIENTENLLISVDGEVFKTSLSEDDIKKAISAKLLNKSVDELTEEEESTYENIKLSTVSSSDLTKFTTLDSTEHENGYYTPVDASTYDYISFDLYFRKESSQELVTNEYDLMFVDENYVKEHTDANATSITSLTDTITLNNTLTTLTKTYNANDTIEVNPADAIRIGVYGYNNQTSYIYEPNEGLGSYAFSSHTDQKDKYDPNCNAMFTYFNNTYKYKLASIPSGSEIETYSLSDKALDTFTITTDDSGKKIYNDVKVTIYIWLEGYDADYIPGIDVSNITTYLSFYVSEKTTKEVSE